MAEEKFIWEYKLRYCNLTKWNKIEVFDKTAEEVELSLALRVGVAYLRMGTALDSVMVRKQNTKKDGFIISKIQEGE